MQLPLEIFDQIVYRVWNAENEFLYLEDDARLYKTFQKSVRRDLATLRLVNKAFCHSASHWLFRHINAKSNSSGTTSSLDRLKSLSKSAYAFDVRQIDFGFEQSSSSVDNSLYIEDLARCKSSVLVNFTNLRALEFREPASSLSQAQRLMYIDTVVFMLRCVPLPRLVELEVMFPITHDFGRFFTNQVDFYQTPIEDIMHRLRHLGLYVCQHTDPVDQRYRLGRVLPQYATLPSATFAPHLSRMIEMTPNLESLMMNSTNMLDIVAAFPSSLRLRSLALGGVSLASHILLSLVSQSADKIKYIDFWHMRLKSGTWEYVVRQLCKLPHLLDVNIDMCGYSLEASSSHLDSGRTPFENCSEDIRKQHDAFLTALGALQRVVNSNRVAIGLRPFSDSDYRHMDRPLLEFEM